MPETMRCFGDGDPAYEQYHDREWGRPVTDEKGLYERLCLEAFQSGLSWRIVLAKRDALRLAFGGFDPAFVAGLSPTDVTRLLGDPSIIRNRAKIEATINNARRTIELRGQGGLVDLLWKGTGQDGATPGSWDEVPATTADAGRLATTLKKAGFRFVGPTTLYSTMQACGIVNDHLDTCPVRAEVEAERAIALARLARKTS